MPLARTIAFFLLLAAPAFAQAQQPQPQTGATVKIPEIPTPPSIDFVPAPASPPTQSTYKYTYTGPLPQGAPTTPYSYSATTTTQQASPAAPAVTTSNVTTTQSAPAPQAPVPQPKQNP